MSGSMYLVQSYHHMDVRKGPLTPSITGKKKENKVGGVAHRMQTSQRFVSDVSHKDFAT